MSEHKLPALHKQGKNRVKKGLSSFSATLHDKFLDEKVVFEFLVSF